MNAPSVWLRPLQVLAAVLAIAIMVLTVAWLRIEPPMPSFAATGAPPTAGTTHPVAAATADAGAAGPAPAAAASTTAVTTPTDVRAPSAQSAVLFGSVKRVDGTPVKDGVFWVHNEGKHVGTAGLSNGTFAFAGLQPGVHRMTSRIADELPLDREVVVHAPSTRLDVQLTARWLLTVDVVTADGAPLAEALRKERPGIWTRSLRALAFPEPLAGDLSGSASSQFEAGLGSFRGNDPLMRERGNQAPLPKQTIGVLTLPPDKPVHVALLLGGSLLANMPAAPGQETITFVAGTEVVLAKFGTVRFRCVDGVGAPVVGARVSVASGSGTSYDPKAVTDAEGRYTARGLLPGQVGFGILHQQLIMPPVRIDLAPGADIDLGDVTLLAAVEFEISFAGSGGDGTVRWSWLDAPANSRWQASDNYNHEQNGAVQKVSLFPGRYAALARGKNGCALIEIDTAALPPGPLRFDLKPSASLQIDNRIGAGFARYEIRTPRNVPVYQGELGSRPGFTLQLPPGDYVATVFDGAGEPKRRPFTLPATGAVLALP